MRNTYNSIVDFICRLILMVSVYCKCHTISKYMHYYVKCDKSLVNFIVKYGSLEAIQFFINCDNCSNDLLVNAIETGDDDIVKYIYDLKYWPPHIVSYALHIAVDTNKLHLISLVGDDYNESVYSYYNESSYNSAKINIQGLYAYVVKNNNMDALIKLLTCRFELCKIKTDLLTMAVEQNNYQIAELLLKSCELFDLTLVKSPYALIEAIENNNIEMIKMLLNNKIHKLSSDTIDPYDVAIKASNYQVVEILAQSKCYLPSNDTIVCALRDKKMLEILYLNDIIELTTKNLNSAIQSGNIESVQFLLLQNVKFDKHSLSYVRDMDMIKYVVSKNIPISTLPNKLLKILDLQSLEYLIDHGAQFISKQDEYSCWNPHHGSYEAGRNDEKNTIDYVLQRYNSTVPSIDLLKFVMNRGATPTVCYDSKYGCRLMCSLDYCIYHNKFEELKLIYSKYSSLYSDRDINNLLMSAVVSARNDENIDIAEYIASICVPDENIVCEAFNKYIENEGSHDKILELLISKGAVVLHDQDISYNTIFIALNAINWNALAYLLNKNMISIHDIYNVLMTDYYYAHYEYSDFLENFEKYFDLLYLQGKRMMMIDIYNKYMESFAEKKDDDDDDDDNIEKKYEPKSDIVNRIPTLKLVIRCMEQKCFVSKPNAYADCDVICH